jgi:hypothetical protein
MLFLLAFFIFLIVVASSWFWGTWNIFLNLIIAILAGTIASSYYENVANFIETKSPSDTYLADFLGLWLLFALSFLAMRLVAEFLSQYRMSLDWWVDIAMRSVFSVILAWVFICFTFFTLHTAPVPTDWMGFQANPETRNLGIGPDRLWLSYVQSRSRGALAEFQDPVFLDADTRPEHPDDVGRNCRVFDPNGDFIFKYHSRRMLLQSEEALRVER